MLNYRNLLLLGLLYCIPADPTNTRIDIHCDDPSITDWCATMVLYEEDNPRHHDIIKTESFCSYKPLKTFEYPNLFLNGDGSRHYEIGYQLSHTCTKDGQHKCMKSPVKRVRVYSTNNVRFFDPIQDVGTYGPCANINSK
ncbi:hypothetical protein B9Z55_015731 [Caenorhabditis nigoni]|uniref:Uncharacterized protein n=2 Tax=Caenorhabditis nigoni TaxID=1611254 RepID=A0A2G5UC44_9PELO|nr:hypothetical protein B9Z55_015731 [Caenorhabditis nigoni]